MKENFTYATIKKSYDEKENVDMVRIGIKQYRPLQDDKEIERVYFRKYELDKFKTQKAVKEYLQNNFENEFTKDDFKFIIKWLKMFNMIK